MFLPFVDTPFVIGMATKQKVFFLYPFDFSTVFYSYICSIYIPATITDWMIAIIELLGEKILFNLIERILNSTLS